MRPNAFLLHADARRIPLRDESVQCVVTDPPYGTGEWTRAQRGNGRVPVAVYSRQDWDVWSLDWLPEGLRVAKGCVAFFCPHSAIAECAHFAETNSLSWRLLAWCKPDPRPSFHGLHSRSVEPIILLRPNRAKRLRRDWCVASSIRSFRDGEAVGHVHQKPESVNAWLVDALSDEGDIVLDPFCGSGTAVLVAQELGRVGIGMDLKAEYLAMARKRTRQGVML